MSLEADIATELEQLRRLDRLRHLTAFGGAHRERPTDPEGRPLLSFASNDYLGLAGHLDLIDAAVATLRAQGLGAGSSQLIGGHSTEHAQLESELAAFLRTEAALLFPTGYQTNLGVLTALAGPSDLIASDAANHASIIDGCRLTRGRVVVYPHASADGAAQALATPGQFRRRLLVTESLFSMDGDRAPLADLASIAARSGAALIVDEAHAFGVLGPSGRGLCAHAGVVPDVLVGTLGKAIGTMGGFVATTRSLRLFLLNRARQFIYTTGSPPAIAAATTAALKLVAGPEGDRLRAQLASASGRLRADLARAGIPVSGRDAILAIIRGTDRNAVDTAAALRARGLFVPAIRPPTVPEGSARLRITLAATHAPGEIDALVAALVDSLTESFGAPPSTPASRP